MKRVRLAVFVVGLLGFGTVFWRGFVSPAPPAAWLRVEAPPTAIAGQTFPVQVIVDAPEDDWIAIDLHWASTRREPRGFLSEGPRQRVDGRASAYTFELPVAVPDDLGHVSVVIFLSPTGRWDDRTAAATTAFVPVQTRGAPEPLAPLPAYDLVRVEGPIATPSSWLRHTLGVLWLASGILLWRGRRRGALAGLAVACLLAALWELSNAEGALAAAVRTAAFAHRLYYERSWLQDGITLGIVAATVAGMVWTLAQPSAHRAPFVRAALVLYAGIALASLVSLHATDRLLAWPVASIPFAQLAKLAIALTVLALASPACVTPPASAPGAGAVPSASARPRAG
jgi:hypothetical protein